MTDKCDHCSNVIPPSAERCSACALPGTFPNVRAAEQDAETQALETRYQGAIGDAAARGDEVRVREFETATSGSVAVIARSVNELVRLASSENELYATYYGLSDGGSRIPKGDKWDRLREVADSALFTGYREHIRFGALSLDGLGVVNWGPCSMVLKDKMIAHRACVFEENSVLFTKSHGVGIADADGLPAGYRARWCERAKLCVAKLGAEIKDDTKPDEFAGKLLVLGATTADDDFIEVHVWGPINIRTLERVVIQRRKRTPSKASIRALRVKLKKLGVPLEER